MLMKWHLAEIIDGIMVIFKSYNVYGAVPEELPATIRPVLWTLLLYNML